MCIHIESQLEKEIRYWRKQGLRNVSGVALYSGTARFRFVGSWLCFADQPQSIAQAVHVLKVWHPDATFVDLSLVNDWRSSKGMPDLSVPELPVAVQMFADEQGVADDDSPEHTRKIVSQWLERAVAAAYARA